MKILIAEDELVSRCLLEDLLIEWGHEVTAVGDGRAAWQVLQEAEAPPLAILDWGIPEMEGTEVCRRLRATPRARPPYVLLLTAREGKENIVGGLRAGANDYLTKPFDPDELLARLNVGIDMVELQQRLADRVRELEYALAHVRQLQSFLPICCYCKRIRDDHNYWHQVEAYIAQNAGTTFSHGVCPSCFDKVTQTTNEELKAILNFDLPSLVTESSNGA
jgi:CheY-like chemotaxis protein